MSFLVNQRKDVRTKMARTFLQAECDDEADEEASHDCECDTSILRHPELLFRFSVNFQEQGDGLRGLPPR